MDDRDWLILKVLYEKMNITRAAQSLYISQPTLTKRIQQMEKEFKVTIVQRGTRGVHFTPQGEYLAKCAEEMLQRLQHIKEQTLNMGEEVSGTLRLGVSNYITQHKLPKLLKLFRERFPKVEYKIITDWSSEVFNLVYNEHVHIGMVRGDYEWSDAKRLLFDEHVCVASKDRIELEDLPNIPRIDYDTDFLLKGLIDNWWSGTFTQPPFIGMEVDKADTCKEMVVNGLGYGILPSVLLEKNPELYRFPIKDKYGEPIIRKTWMLYHNKALEIKLVKEFVSFIEGLDFKQDI